MATKTEERVEASVIDCKVEKKVKVKLERKNKDQEDQVVWVNDKRYLIKRGVYVEVPESVAKVLEERDEMIEYSYDFIDKHGT